MILLLLTDPLGLSYTQIGLISISFTAASSLTQPLFGYLADRFGGRPLVVGSVIWIALAMGAMGFATDFKMLLALAPLAGLGAAAFHPLGAANAARVSRERRGAGMSIFLVGGNAGFAVGPLLAGSIFTVAGVHGTSVLSLMALVLVPLLHFGMSRSMAISTENSRHTPGSTSWNADVAVVSVLALMAVIFFRSWTYSSLVTYLPQFYKSMDMSVTFASWILFAVLIFLAAGNVLGGLLSDRFGRRRVIFASLLVAAPLGRLLLESTSPLGFLVAGLLGLAIGASFPVTLVMAQEMVPSGLGVMSGIALGFTFIAGGIGSALTGFVSDHLGLAATMHAIIWLPLVGVVWALALPLRRPATQYQSLTESAHPSR
jgi:FSR family fosmidomycin resistance protein-like MFS transporter